MPKQLIIEISVMYKTLVDWGEILRRIKRRNLENMGRTPSAHDVNLISVKKRESGIWLKRVSDCCPLLKILTELKESPEQK